MKIYTVFDNFMKECIRPYFHEHGFAAKKNTFFIRKSNNCGLISFKKSSTSSFNETIFTIEIGISSQRLQHFFSHTYSIPTIDKCHWSQRIGFLLPHGSDLWWTVNCSTDLYNLCKTMKKILSTYAIRELETYISDESLRDLWLTGKSPGLTDIQRLLNLSVILSDIGPQSILDEIVDKLLSASSGKPVASVVSIYINKLLQGYVK